MARIRFDKLIDYYLPTHTDFYHPENTQELTGNIQGDKIHIDEAVTIGDSNAPYAQYEFVTLGETDNQKVFYLSLFGKDASKEPLQIVEDIEASNAKALRVTAGHTAVFQTPYPYNPQTLKKMVVRLKAITKGDIRVGLVGISNKATVKPNGDVGFPTATTDVDFYEIVVSEDNVDNIGYDYQTLMGYFKNVVNNPLTDNNPETDEPQTFPTLNPNAPYALRKHTTDVALAFKCLEGEYYIDSLEILDVENYYTDIPGAPEEGPPGLDGLNTAVVFLYKRSATTPNKPSTTATYNFTTGVLTGHNNGWSQNVQAIDGNPLWVIQATVSALASEETATILPAKWGTQIKLVEDGADGATGASGINQATIYLYQRKASEPNVLDIADPITYKFSDGTITGSLGDWSRSVPAGSLPLYVTLAVAIGNGATDTIPRSEWTYPVQMVKDGVDGEDYEGIELITVPSDIMITKRGLILTPLIAITAKLHNISNEVTWTVSDGTLVFADPTDDTRVNLLVDTIEGESTTITATVGGYVETVTLHKIHTGTLVPFNFGDISNSNDIPEVTPSGEPLMNGDYFIWISDNTTINGTEFIKGQIYERAGDSWVPTSNGDLVMTLFDSFSKLANTTDREVIGHSVIKDLVAINAFIEALRVISLRVEAGGLNVEISPDGYVDPDNGNKYAIFRVTDASGEELISINGKDKKLLLYPDGGIWRGSLSILNTDDSEVLVTRQRELGANPSASPTKTLYAISDLITAVNATTTTPKATTGATNTYKGATISKACFRTGSGKLTYGSDPLSVSSGTTSGTKTASLTLPTNLGAQKVIISGSKGTNTKVKRNGTEITGSLPPVDYVAGDIFTVEATRSTHYTTYYKYDWTKYTGRETSTGILYWEMTSWGNTGWSTTTHSQASLPSAPTRVGQVKTIYSNREDKTETSYSSNTISLTLTYESASSHPAGFVFITSTGAYLTLSYTSGYLIEANNSIQINSWNSQNNKNYISGTDILTTFSTIADGTTVSTTPASSSLTHFEELTGGDKPLTAIDTVIKTPTGMTFYSLGTSRSVSRFGGDGESSGVYKQFNATIQIEAVTPAVKVTNLVPVSSTTNVGENGAEFNIGYFNTVYSDINSEDTRNTYQVWGAVFN